MIMLLSGSASVSGSVSKVLGIAPHDFASGFDSDPDTDPDFFE